MNKTIAIIYNKELKPETEYAAMDAVDYFRSKDCKTSVNPKTFKLGTDFAIVFGGDGLLLHTANQVASCEIPIIGVNYGRVGYLCTVDKYFNHGVWNKILKEEYHVESRTRISAEITHPEGVTEIIDALNEISIGGIDKTVYLKMFINPQFSKQKQTSIEAIGDGIIFSTKTGSTAYNVNAGGSVLLTDVFSVVANNCLFQSDKLPINTKALVTNIDTQFEVEVTNKNKGNLPWLVADGQRRHKITESNKIIIKKSSFETKFISV